MGSMPGEAPILVNSAGCGAALKEYGRLLGTDEARRFSGRVFDVHEWIAGRLDTLARSPPQE
jgi:glycolate oxidase iron-sulfur subunit